MMDTIAVIAMGFIAFFLGCSTYLLNTIRNHHVLVVASLKGINAAYLEGIEIVTNDMQKLEARLRILERDDADA